MNYRMNRDKLNIGTYILRPYARTEAHIRDLRDAGIDFVTCMENDRAALDLFARYNVGAVLSGIVPSWWGGDGDRAGQLEKTNPIDKYVDAAAKFVDHPAVWGIDVGDEPSALDFPYYGKVIDKVNSLFPKQFAYLNLYPNYASVSQNTASQTVNQLGTPTYAEHIDQYVKYVGTDYICYDFYLYSINVPKAYENLRVVSDACLRTGRSMWIVLQVNSNREEEWITEDGLRFQAYTAMAFGAENIIWACWTAGWWHNQVVDENGKKTQQYEKLKKVNAEIHRLANMYDNYRRTATHFVGFEGTDWLEGVNVKSTSSLDSGFFFDVKAENGMPLVIGEMTGKKRSDGHALFVCAADDPYGKDPKTTKILFTAREKTVHAYGGDGDIPVTKNGDVYSVEIKSNAGIIITAF